MASRVMDIARASLRSAEIAALNRIRPWAMHFWANPLLRHARRQKPFAVRRAVQAAGIAALALSALSAAAWVMNLRLLGAALMGLSMAGALAPAVIAPVASADRVARQLHSTRQDPRRLVGDLAPQEIAAGLALVTLWRLRWLIVTAAALTPALMVGILRIDVADFTVWRESAQVLGGATAAGRSPFLTAEGSIPTFRLVLRALSAGLLAWIVLPLIAELGVTAAFTVRDVSLSALVALLGEVLVALIVGGLWEFVSRTPLLAGGLEILRMLLLILLGAALVLAAVRISRYNCALIERAAPATAASSSEITL